jgi:hypothetical protein
MNKESTGGPAAESVVKERLARRFAQELDRAEQDYPSLPTRQWDTAERLKGPGRVWRRLAVEAVAILVLVGVLVVVYGRPSTEPPAPSAATASLGADGIPNQIDGQRVYRVTDKVEWRALSGGFLLGAYVVRYTPPCPPRLVTLPPAEAALIATCSDQGFPQVNLMASAGDPYNDSPLFPAALGASALDGWVDGLPIVMRAHTHDASAAQCQADQLAACQAALVVESVVWPSVPTEIAGEHVYRAADKATFGSLKGSFLLGGLVTTPDVIPPCAAPMGKSDAELQLIPYCSWVAVDGAHLAPKGLAMADLKNQIEAVRVHVNDPLAAQCPAAVLAECQAAIVVESVVWRSSPYGTPSPTVTAPTPAAPTPPTLSAPLAP